MINRQAPADQPFFLYVAYLAPHSGGPNRPANQPQSRCEGTAKPAVRHLGAFDNEPLPTPPNFNEADVSRQARRDRQPRPSSPTRRSPTIDAPLPLPARVAARRRRGRRRASIDALRASGELDNTLVVYTSDNGFFAGEHRVAERQEPRLRGGDPRAAR